MAFQGSTQFNIGYGDIFVENLGCTGDEERLTDCPGDFYQSTTCTHNQDAALICPCEIRELTLLHTIIIIIVVYSVWWCTGSTVMECLCSNSWQ